LAALRTLIGAHREASTYDRVSVGFPGVVVENVVHTAPNLDPAWRNFALGVVLEKTTSRPVRVLNDAGVQGFGVVSGHGVEMVLTLGTGMGCALFVDGRYVPNLELAHHPFRKGKTYEEYVGLAALAKIGKKRWSRRVGRVIDVVLPIFNPQRLYLGGGNAHHLKLDLPPRVTICENAAGLLGGIALWRA
jgi:polyphosphate glucokinase